MCNVHVDVPYFYIQQFTNVKNELAKGQTCLWGLSNVMLTMTVGDKTYTNSDEMQSCNTTFIPTAINSQVAAYAKCC